ncbi:PAS domain S-box protein [Pontibacter sp. 172403-2]|uniref:PAS domain-containing sensor histidine kinase n=1 Tax=Pontibacter rufus TaxID=2791028 RepID=UPI0018AF6074|nr:PAS domain-containing sensor histidine kinase [Pontibacter sp. 172403-2]MBF9254052.1 PAS domain S-box protein [Pontibacter sp. 172403-2]
MNSEQDKISSVHRDLSTEDHYRLLVDSITDYAIFMLDPAGNVATWNEGARKMKGYGAHEIIGKYFGEFYTAEARQQGYPAYELKQARTVGRFEDEGWRLRKDKTIFWANVVITPIYNADNVLLGFAKITRDLTERRRNEELMQKNKELVRINNDLDSFVYTASHDLKSPITNLEGLLIALKEDLGPDEEKHKEIMSRMGDSITNLKKVVADLAEVIKLQQQEEMPEIVNIPELLVEIRENLHGMIQASKADIEADFSGFESLKYARKNLRSIVYNLVSNAIKYADPSRTPKISIKTSLSAAGEHVLSVADNGLGVESNQISKMYTMFKRFHDHVEGSGIGLYLVRKILDNSGDRIAVESQVGKGSVFTIYFNQGDTPY